VPRAPRRRSRCGTGDPPPSIAGEPNQFAEVGVPWALSPLVSDLDAQAVRVRIVKGPAGMSAAGRTVTWRPRASQIGIRDFTLEAADSAGGTVRVRCLKRGAHTVSIHRADGTSESLRRGLTVVGKRCARKGRGRR